MNLKLLIITCFAFIIAGCVGNKPPQPIELPGSPVERAAILGLQTSYRDSTMWEIQKPRMLNVTPAAPTAIMLQEYDPKELYCVCVEYEARYKVSWTTTDPSPWERTVRNLLVMKTQADTYLAARPMNICAPLCEYKQSCMPELSLKYQKLLDHLTQLKRLIIAFSGGVDSTFLLKAASEVLAGDDLLAVSAQSLIFPEWEQREAVETAGLLKVRHLILEVDALKIPQIIDNPPDRCYYCKKTIFTALTQEAQKRDFNIIADGSNLDDVDDFRPGGKAVRELGIISPLKEAGLTKNDIRKLSAGLNLPTHNKPSYACLASRFPYGQIITKEKLKMVEEAENFLKGLGFRETRVRHHGTLARIEVGSDERAKFFDQKFMDSVEKFFHSLGFDFAALDLGGFRSGGFNKSVNQAYLYKYK